MVENLNRPQELRKFIENVMRPYQNAKYLDYDGVMEGFEEALREREEREAFFERVEEIGYSQACQWLAEYKWKMENED